MKLSSYWSSLGKSVTGLLLAFSTYTCDADLAQVTVDFDTVRPYGHNLFGAFPAGFYQNPALATPATAVLMGIHPEQPKFRVAAFMEDAESHKCVVAYSRDGGNSWTQVDFLGRNVHIQNYTVRGITFSKKGGIQGTVFLYGETENSLFVCSSMDGGKSWKSPQILAKSEGQLSVNGGDLFVDPLSEQTLLHAYTTTLDSKTYFGDLFVAKSIDFAKTWSQPHKIYSINNDFHTKFSKLGGGQCVAPTLAAVKQDRKSATLSAFLRIYPNNNSCYSQNMADDASGIDPNNGVCVVTGENSLFDRVVIRSVDGGKSWDKHATLVAPEEFSHFAVAFDPRARDRVGIHTFDSSLGTSVAVDNNSGIVYMAWQAGHNSPESEFQELPQVWLSFSKDMGLTWSKPVVASQTSRSFSAKKANLNDQAFGPKLFVAEDGIVGITYYDYRHNKNSADKVATDAWLAEFQLNKERNGVELIREVRLTATSFDSSPAFTK